MFSQQLYGSILTQAGRFVNRILRKDREEMQGSIGGPGKPEKAMTPGTAEKTDGFLEEEDAEAAAICLTCTRPECRLDRNKPCLRYRRGIRAIRRKRAALAEEPDPAQIAMEIL